MTIAAASCVLRPAFVAVALVVLAACESIYGASFDYPDAPAAPPSSRVLVTDEGWDDDDPMRARVQVIDVGSSTELEVMDFYRATYGADEGWGQLKVAPRFQQQELCLIRHSDDDYAEFVEVFQYQGSRVEAKPSRYLVMRSRLESLEPGRDQKTCGLATSWISSDLLRF